MLGGFSSLLNISNNIKKTIEQLERENLVNDIVRSAEAIFLGASSSNGAENLVQFP